MRIQTLAVALLATGALAPGLPRRAEAQDSVKTAIIWAAEIANREFLRGVAPQDRAKFEQYRAVPTGPLFQQFFLRFTPADSLPTLQLSGHRLGELDQSLWFRAHQPGQLDFQVRWDRIPHTFSTTARALGTETLRGVYTLPVPRPDTATLNSSAYLAPVRTRWDPIKLSLAVTPKPEWDFKAEYTHTGKNGDRPMGMAMGGSGNNTREILEPIDQTTHDFRISQSYARPRYQVMVAYGLSQFTNALQSVTSDNPLVTVDTLRAGTSRGRTALAPNNIAQSLTATAGVNLPRRTRITGTFAYGWRAQNQALIAPTINARNLDSLARAAYVFPTSLHGSVHTTSANLSLNSRPLRTLTVTARYRRYDFQDKTPDISVPILVISDRTLAAGAEREAFPFTQDNADVSAGWRPIPALGLTAGYGWDRMDRDTAVRNVNRDTEKTRRVSLDYSGIEWLTLRGSVSYATRRGDLYHQVSTSENPDTRRFDEADRNLTRVSFLALATPIDQIDVMGTLDVGIANYIHSDFGVQKDNSTAVGGEVDWSPSPRFSIGGGYVRESYRNEFMSRYRTGSTPATLANPTWTWLAINTDVSNVVSANVRAVLIPDRLEAGGLWEYSKAHFLMAAANLATPSGGTAAQNAAATAMDFPKMTQKLQPLTVYVRYLVLREWAMTLQYQSDFYNAFDFRTTGLQPATGNHVFLGNDLRNYGARYLTVALSYRPGLLKRSRSTM
jgi:MtrB/PioB family decaheme-associated outer membrane protein